MVNHHFNRHLGERFLIFFASSQHLKQIRVINPLFSFCDFTSSPQQKVHVFEIWGRFEHKTISLKQRGTTQMMALKITSFCDVDTRGGYLEGHPRTCK